MKDWNKNWKNIKENIIIKNSQTPLAFIRWIGIGILVGVLVGAVGTAFYLGLQWVTNLRMTYVWLVYLLPVAGLLIVFLNRIFHLEKRHDTNMVLESVRTDKDLPFKMAPMIFVSTLLTHLCGGSAGREGAALQLGGSLATKIGQWLRLNKKDMHVITMCGMSACFAAVFGTPAAAAIFAIEVVSVGIMHYSALVPCTIAAVIGSSIAHYFGAPPEVFSIAAVPSVDILSMVRVIALAILCAALSVVFCKIMRKTGSLYKQYIPNNYLKIAIGGTLVALFSMLFGKEYLGSGANLIENAMTVGVKPESFAIKLLLTALTLQAGFKGGEIVPSLCIGATFGYTIGMWIGIPPAFAASVGMVTIFCGVTNCPVTSFVLSLEMFGVGGIPFYLVAIAVGYMLSGYTGLYPKQKIMYSKIETKYIDTLANSKTESL